MGLIELTIAALCLNTTCVEDKDYYAISSNIRRTFLDRLANELKDETLILTTIQNDRLSGTEERNKTLSGAGVAFDILHILQRKYHFNYTIVKPGSNVWASSGDKEGVMEMLKHGKANLSAGFHPVLTEYATEISYSPSLDTGEWVVLMKRPEASATGSGLLAPFTLPVWLLILVSLILVGPVIFFIIYMQSKLCRDDENIIFPLPACIWFVYGALLKQGTTLNPMTDSSRLLFSTWWIFITILTAFYTANLTAFLTLSKFTLPITEPKDIGAKRYKWVSTAGNTIQDTTPRATSTENYLTDIGKLLGRPYVFTAKTDSEILTEFVTKSDIMFIREKPIVEYVMYDDYKQKTKKEIEEPKRCTYVITKFAVASFSRAFAYSREFKYKPLFDSALVFDKRVHNDDNLANKRIQYLVESGIIKFKLREQLPDTEICPLNLGNKERQLRNSDLTMTYEIVGGGFIISVIVFVVEMFFCHQKEKQNRSNEKLFVPNPKKQVVHINHNNNHEKFGQVGQISKFITPPPSYHTLFNPPNKNENIKKKNINGREYWVYDSMGGGPKMIPTRTPSALLFQYTN